MKRGLIVASWIIGAAPWTAGALAATMYPTAVAMQSAATVALVMWTPACIVVGLLASANQP